jgi:hypothetical protein
MKRITTAVIGLCSLGLYAAVALEVTGIISKPGNANAEFDLINTSVTREGQNLVFTQTVSGKAGSITPAASGKFGGSRVFSYVWPTSLDSSSVGFASKQGVLALAATFHPDFDDGASGTKNRTVWHSHWVVLVPDDACGKGNLKVKDIPEGSKPKLPATWPGAPILIDSPAFEPSFNGSSIRIEVPLKALGFRQSFNFDGVTAGLQVNSSIHTPLLCVKDVFDVASGDLSLPGKVGK